MPAGASYFHLKTGTLEPITKLFWQEVHAWGAASLPHAHRLRLQRSRWLKLPHAKDCKTTSADRDRVKLPRLHR